MPGFSFHFQAAACPYSHDFSNTLWHKPFIFSYICKKIPARFSLHEISHFFFSRAEGKILFTYFLFLLKKAPCDQRLSPLRRRSSPLRPVLSGWFCHPGDRPTFFAPGSSRYFIRLRKLGTQLPGGRKTSCRKCFHSRACFL